MPKFIEQLYYGNIDPQARSTGQNKTIKKQMASLIQSEEFLKSVLSGELKDKFVAFDDAWTAVNNESNLDSFIVGFRLGAHFAYDTFVSNDAPFTDYIND
jgi:hypothetical protein